MANDKDLKREALEGIDAAGVAGAADAAGVAGAAGAADAAGAAGATGNLDELEAVDTQLGDDDLLCNLFSAFDDVSASDELQSATLAAIFAMEDAAVGKADLTSSDNTGKPTLSNTTSPSDGSPENIASSPSQPLPNNANSEVRAVAGGNRSRAARRAKWRAIRVAAIAACLALALTGGVAYATPVSYYDVTQGASTVTLGVNCFGLTVSASSADEEGAAVIASTDLHNMPYQEAMARAIEQMELRNPDKPVEFGPQGGEHETVPPRNEDNAGTNAEGPQPDSAKSAPDDQAGANTGAGAGSGTSQPKDAGANADPDVGQNASPDAGANNASNQPQGYERPDHPNETHSADRR